MQLLKPLEFVPVVGQLVLVGRRLVPIVELPSGPAKSSEFSKLTIEEKIRLCCTISCSTAFYFVNTITLDAVGDVKLSIQ